MRVRAATVLGVALVALAVGTTTGSASSLTGSAFEIDADANLVVNTPGNIDWLNDAGTALRSGVRAKQDKPTGQNDDAFGQGTAEDQAVPTVVTGSIPPNKSDLRYFGVLTEKTPAGSFLHLFWTRVQDPKGTTNMDFEFNQSSTLSSNGVTPVRTVGDLLIEYHLDNGGTVATLTLREWAGSAWGPEKALTGKAIGSINSSFITAAASDGVGPLDPRTFGEASIDLNAVLGTGRCKSFGSAYLKSRSSDSFTAEIKDFIAPEAVSVTNCGSVLVKKTDFDSGAALSGAKFSVSPGSTDASGNTAASTQLTEYPGGLYCADNLLFGSHTVTEDAAPPGYDVANPSSQSVNVGDNGTCADRIASGGGVDATFRDPAQRGAIVISKSAKSHASPTGSSPLAGAVFSVGGQTVTTDANGSACVENLAFGDYIVHEVSAPSGYSLADDQTVHVGTKADCSGTGTPAQANVTDTPLSRITVSFASLAGPGITAATIQCTGDESSSALPEGTPRVLDNLPPGTYSCTVVVDP